MREMEEDAKRSLKRIFSNIIIGQWVCNGAVILKLTLMHLAFLVR